jgi:hypothetical protein
VIKRTLPAEMRWIFWLGPIGIYLIRSTMRAALRKYPKEYDEEELKAALTKIQVGLQAPSSGYLLGDSLSFAGAPGLTRMRIDSMTREGVVPDSLFWLLLCTGLLLSKLIPWKGS